MYSIHLFSAPSVSEAIRPLCVFLGDNKYQNLGSFYIMVGYINKRFKRKQPACMERRSLKKKEKKKKKKVSSRKITWWHRDLVGLFEKMENRSAFKSNRQWLPA